MESVSCTEVGNIVRNTCISFFSIFILVYLCSTLEESLALRKKKDEV